MGAARVVAASCPASRRDGACERWAFYGSQLVHREEVAESDGCRLVSEARIDVAQYPTHLWLRNRIETSRSSCTGLAGLGARGGGGEALRFIGFEREGEVWRWVTVSGALVQDPVAYHPDDAELWSRTRAGCEASLTREAPAR